MSLPDSRNTTYDGVTPVKSADLNDIQDWLVSAGRYNESSVRAALSVGMAAVPTQFSAPVVDIRIPQFIFGGTTSQGYWYNREQPPALVVNNPPNAASCNTSYYSAAGDGTIGLVAMNSTASTATRLLRWNGSSWATANLPVSYNGAARCAFIGTNFYVAQADGAVYSSATGATGSWSAATALPVNTDYRHFDFVAQGGGVAIGCRGLADTPNGYVLRTTNGGTSWSAVLLPGTTPAVHSVERDTMRNIFVAVGTQNSLAAIWTSTDGASWTLLPTPTLGHAGTAPTILDGILCFGGIYVISGFSVPFGAMLFTSNSLSVLREIYSLSFSGGFVMRKHKDRILCAGVGSTTIYMSGLL